MTKNEREPEPKTIDEALLRLGRATTKLIALLDAQARSAGLEPIAPHWKLYAPGDYQCSNCEVVFQDVPGTNEFDFCPNCGARMFLRKDTKEE